MPEMKRIVVRGQVRDVTVEQLLEVLLAIADEWQQPLVVLDSPDTFDAAIEDHAAKPGEPSP